jgi:hypothetical protein
MHFSTLTSTTGKGHALWVEEEWRPENEVEQSVGVGVLVAADGQSTSSSGYRASLWDP